MFLLCLVLVVVSAPPCCPSYVVKSTDGASSIAAANGVSEVVLAKFNRASVDAPLNAGQTITLPCPRALAFFKALQTPPDVPLRAPVPKAAAKLIG